MKRKIMKRFCAVLTAAAAALIGTLPLLPAMTVSAAVTLTETGISYEVDHLAVIHENFFHENSGSLKGLECHEIALYFIMRPRGTKELCSNSYTMGVKETMHWIPIEKLDEYKAFPSFMKEYLQSDHSGIKHIVTDERM